MISPQGHDWRKNTGVKCDAAIYPLEFDFSSDANGAIARNCCVDVVDNVRISQLLSNVPRGERSISTIQRIVPPTTSSHAAGRFCQIFAATASGSKSPSNHICRQTRNQSPTRRFQPSRCSARARIFHPNRQAQKPLNWSYLRRTYPRLPCKRPRQPQSLPLPLRHRQESL